MEKVAKDGERIRFALIDRNYRAERQKYNINFIIFETFLSKNVSVTG